MRDREYGIFSNHRDKPSSPPDTKEQPVTVFGPTREAKARRRKELERLFAAEKPPKKERRKKSKPSSKKPVPPHELLSRSKGHVPTIQHFNKG